MPSGKLTERLEHSRGNCPPVVHEVDRPAVEAYLQRKKAQDKKRRGGPGAAEVAGGGQPPLPPPQGAAATLVRILFWDRCTSTYYPPLLSDIIVHSIIVANQDNGLAS
jgi:hypothetical protein